MAAPVSGRFVSRLTRDTLALILAGGRGTRLKQLTDWRAKPAVPFGGKFRIIDFLFPIAWNSGIRQVRCTDAIQSAFADSSYSTRLGFFARRAARVCRGIASAASALKPRGTRAPLTRYFKKS